MNIENYTKRLTRFFLYVKGYLENGDFISIISFFIYSFSRGERSWFKGRIVNSGMGEIYCRKNTNDFKFANINFEPKIKSLILNNIDKYNAYMDLGSCIGEYGVWLDKKGFSVHLFEPTKENFRSIEINMLLNNSKCKIYNMGVGKERSIASINFNSKNTGASNLTVNASNPNKTYTVKVDSIDNIYKIEKIPNQDTIIKIDVEGMEVDVIEGMQEYLTTAKNIMLIIEDLFADTDKIRNALENIGDFNITRVDDENIVAIKE